jgi:hypothetical protein
VKLASSHGYLLVDMEMPQYVILLTGDFSTFNAIVVKLIVESGHGKNMQLVVIQNIGMDA